MNDVIKSIAIILAVTIASIIIGAYVFYFVGMATSLAAGVILGASNELIAVIFAWIGVLAALLSVGAGVVAGVVRANRTVEIDFDELKKAIDDAFDDADNND